jgi:hypothetical protein
MQSLIGAGCQWVTATENLKVNHASIECLSTAMRLLNLTHQTWHLAADTTAAACYAASVCGGSIDLLHALSLQV